MMLRNQSAHADPQFVGRDFAPQHLEYLRARAISVDVARANGLFSASKTEVAPLVGKKWMKSGGLAIPYRTRPDEKNPYYRVRLDTPIEREDGEKQRTAVPSFEDGGPVRPYVAPTFPDHILSDTSREIVFVEAPPKALALLSVDIPAIGLGGVNAGGHDKAHKDTSGELRLHQELLELIAWEGRPVVILMDSDRETNSGVYQGEKLLARCLEKAGAVVRVAELPHDAAGEKQGPDDFLAHKGEVALRQVIAAARPAGEVHHPLKEIARRLRRSDPKKGQEQGRPLPSSYNAALILDLDPRWEGVLAYDKFSMRAVARRPPSWEKEYASQEATPGGEWRDEDDTRLSLWLEDKWGVKLSEAQTANVARVAAQKNTFHPVQEYLRALKWDGVRRLDTWLVDYFGAESTPYTRAVGAKWLISAVARAFKPGCESKYMLILEGAQDIGKSQALRGLVGDEWFTDQISDFGRKDAGHDLWGKWVVELAELDKVIREEPTTTKTFLGRQVDHFRPSHGRRSQDYLRQCAFVGTVNGEAYLKDETGGVRFWPVRCTRADRAGVKRDRDQLWAEAVARFQDGEKWWLEDGEVIAQAREEQEARYVGDAWEEQIASHLSGKESVSVGEVLFGCFGRRPEQWEQREQSRVAKALGRLGWERYSATVGKTPDGKQKREWRYKPRQADPVAKTGSQTGTDEKPSGEAASTSSTSSTSRELRAERIELCSSIESRDPSGSGGTTGSLDLTPPSHLSDVPPPEDEFYPDGGWDI